MPNLSNDQAERESAIDPTQSFIVQAPAGSGKTELLTQRFLRLLSCAEKNPEEIIAITFTRKAAAEMRQRVIDALKQASQPMPEEKHRQVTWQLAKAALGRDKQLNWNCVKNPNRLRILTIDALSAYLVRQIPIASQLSPDMNMIDRPRAHYQEAVETIFLRLPNNPSWKPAIERLLLHLDNRAYLLENLLIEILSKREQWLPHITGHQQNTSALRQHMENALHNVVAESLQLTQSLLSEDILAELIPLANFAGLYCVEHDPDNPIVRCNKLLALSDSTETLSTWLGIAHLLLTQKGEWRKSVTKRHGFPPKNEMKLQMISFLESLADNDALRSALHHIQLAPPLTYNEQQWQIIEALLEVLPIIAAQLNVIFSRDNVIDFVELNLAALRALGDSESPTDLAMHLDYRINHLLIDEFQDTSMIQFQLIEKLIDAWQPNDGRSIFLVGDPMQSIYRFRNAEVGLFLRSQQQGIAHIPLHSLKLTQNFRSAKNIVNWNNENFDTIFPKEVDISVGATPYSPAQAMQTSSGQTSWHATVNDDGNAEAAEVVKIIQRHQENTPDDSIAILVRSRSHLYTITEHLHQENIPFQAIELEPLRELGEIRDIHTITRALLHHADRIAWLALLRAPYCGLKLEDLYRIAEAASHKTIWSTLKSDKIVATLSSDAQLRLQHCLPALCNALENKGRLPFNQILRTLWREIGASETLSEGNQHTHVANYLNLIDEIEAQNKPLSLAAITERLNALYAEPNAPETTQLQIMTIHKAKGLEFDHVLLPELHRKSPYDRHDILKWLERPNRQQKSDLILAPIKAIDQKHDAIYNYLKRIAKTKADLECARLFYVAATRAKKSLHLFANAVSEEDTLKPPSKGSFLQLLWGHAEPYFQPVTPQKPIENEIEVQEHSLRRFTKHYLESRPIPTFKKSTYSRPPNTSIGDPGPRQLGTLIHKALEQLALKGKIDLEQWPALLLQTGIPKAEHETTLQSIHEAITRTQEDPRGQWILSNQHQETRCELPLSFFDKDQLKNIIIDRTFIDEKGTRWIIDYKTSTTTDNDIDIEKYRQQLETYAKAMQLYDQPEDRPICLGLYFPLNGHWIEWEFAPDALIA